MVIIILDKDKPYKELNYSKFELQISYLNIGK